jgi:4-diphosphocytidyl-2-C-methyl-D-erythritol kinase
MPRDPSIFVPAHAKVNLTLAVLGKRSDGYHELASLLQTVSLHDVLRITTRRDGVLACHCDVPTLGGADNLALRAAALLREAAGDPALGADLELRKDTPIQGGMGGGSSDAACALLALNALWGVDLPHDRLEALGARLGSDVPFFLTGGTARIAGRGEQVIPLPDAEPLWLLLAKPPAGVATATVFGRLTLQDYGSADDTDAVARAILAGEALPFDRLTNTLEPAVFATYPEVSQVRDALTAAGAPVVRMSGSGPTLYAPFRDLRDAVALLARAEEACPHDVRLWLCHTLTRRAFRAAL